MNHAERGVYVHTAGTNQIFFFFFAHTVCDSNLGGFSHKGMNSTNHMEADLFSSDNGHFHMWSDKCLAASVL